MPEIDCRSAINIHICRNGISARQAHTTGLFPGVVPATSRADKSHRAVADPDLELRGGGGGRS